MSNENLKFYSTRDLFDKAKRDFIVMENNLTADTVFNFFSTVYHVKDWIKFYHPHLQNDIDAYCCDDMDFILCEEICLKGKYIGTDDSTFYRNGACYEINLDGVKHPVFRIGEIIIKKIEHCFEKFNI